MNFPWLVLGVLGAAALSGAAARLTRQYAAAAIAGSAAILLLHSTLYLRYTSDDAYISYRYARNLSDGLGLVWNPRRARRGLLQLPLGRDSRRAALCRRRYRAERPLARLRARRRRRRWHVSPHTTARR